VVYKGPWKQVRDDDGHVFHRGQRMAVCDKSFEIKTDPVGPYAGQVVPALPHVDVLLEDAKLFGCDGSSIRHPRQTKGFDYQDTRTADGSPTCTPCNGCC